MAFVQYRIFPRKKTHFRTLKTSSAHLGERGDDTRTEKRAGRQEDKDRSTTHHVGKCYLALKYLAAFDRGATPSWSLTGSAQTLVRHG